MTDELKESGLESTENKAEPKPDFSKDAAKTSPESLQEIANALIEKLSPQVIEIAKKAAQSEKDVGIASAKRDASKALEATDSMRGVVEKFQAYVTAYGSEERAYAELERDARMDKLESSGSGPDSVGAEAKSWEIEQKEILDSVGLKIDDQRVLDLAASKKWGEGKEGEQAYLKALKASTFVWFRGGATKPEPDASTTTNTLGSQSSSTGDFPAETGEQLGERMITLMANRTANQPEILKIEAELKRRDTLKT